MSHITVHVVGDNTVLYSVLGALGGVALGSLATWLLQRSKISADREHVELEAIRKVLDEGGEALSRGSLNMYRIGNLWRQGLTDEHPSKVDAEAEQRELAALAHSVHSRLRLRLTEDDPVLSSYDTATKALNDVGEFMVAKANPTNFGEHQSEIEALLHELGSCIENFSRPVQQRYGPKIKAPSTDVPREE
jgi:hypothetical protein